MTHLKVEGHLNLIRDEATNAILNTSMSDYHNYMRLKKIKENETKKVEELETELNNIKDDLTEIKNLLRGIVDGSK